MDKDFKDLEPILNYSIALQLDQLAWQRAGYITNYVYLQLWAQADPLSTESNASDESLKRNTVQLKRDQRIPAESQYLFNRLHWRCAAQYGVFCGMTKRLL